MEFFKKIIRPILFRMPEETAHEFALNSLRFALGSELARKRVRRDFSCDEFGKLKRFGLSFENPIGIAAGFDKNGIAVEQLAALGFGFVEVGSVTFHAQEGNPKPRLFRLPKDRALINRAGFNNDGADEVARRLRKIKHECVVGINIGKSRVVPFEEAAEDYLKTLETVYDVADYIVVNVSSPNTPNLRELQTSENLGMLLGELQKRNRELSYEVLSPEVSSPAFRRLDVEESAKAGTQNMKPLLVKIAPDLSDGEIEAIVDVCMRNEIAGIVATNTTIAREGLRTPPMEIERIGEGGLSGAPLQNKSNQVIAKIFHASKGNLPIVGVGGIFSGEDAFAKISSGASLIQAYTGFVYEGPAFARNVNRALGKILRSCGFTSLDDAIGSGVE